MFQSFAQQGGGGVEVKGLVVMGGSQLTSVGFPTMPAKPPATPAQTIVDVVDLATPDC
jgi:hypothetical protein